MPKKPSKQKLDRVSQYARDVLDGKIITGRLVRLACERHFRDLKQGGKRGITFSADYAHHAIDFFSDFLRLNEGEFANEPFNLSDSQQFIVGSLFGWIKADGWRRYRNAYIEQGKGSGKSPLAAGIAIYGLIMDGEIGAEIYCAAVTRDQAGICFRDVKHMAEKSAFADRLTITEHNIAYPATNSFIRPVSSEARSLDGKRVFMSILDEVHEHQSPLVIDKMTAGNKGRMQPMNLRITNSGYDRTSVCWYEHEYSREVLENLHIDDDWFAYVCQLDVCKKCLSEGKSSPQDECNKCDHWPDESVWLKANPNLGKSITWEYLRSEVNKALKMPSKALTVKRLNFCIWTEQVSHWLPLDDWDECAVKLPPDYLLGRRCFAGLDLADTSDTASLVLVFPPLKPVESGFPPEVVAQLLSEQPPRWVDRKPDIDSRYFILPFIWIPEDMSKRTEQEQQRFRAWHDQGYIAFTPGNFIDYSFILATIAECRTRYDVKGLAFDRWGSSKITTDLCDTHGFTTEEKEAKNYNKPLLVGFGQGFASMSPPTKEVATMLAARTIAHDGNPVLRWMAGNVVIEQDAAGNQKPNKGKSTEKIDAAVAMVMGVGLAVQNSNNLIGSKYETSDLLVL